MIIKNNQPLDLFFCYLKKPNCCKKQVNLCCRICNHLEECLKDKDFKFWFLKNCNKEFCENKI